MFQIARVVRGVGRALMKLALVFLLHFTTINTQICHPRASSRLRSVHGRYNVDQYGEKLR